MVCFALWLVYHKNPVNLAVKSNYVSINGSVVIFAAHFLQHILLISNESLFGKIWDGLYVLPLSVEPDRAEKVLFADCESRLHLQTICLCVCVEPVSVSAPLDVFI